MNFFLAWLVTGAIVGWAFKTFVPGQRALVPSLVLGVVGAFVGGWLANAYGKAPVLGPSIMGAVLGAAVFSAILLGYQLRQKRA
ncbi:MAG: GlsB/YeaQ/YmgE family stress response membrane protein [bacterium]